MQKDLQIKKKLLEDVKLEPYENILEEQVGQETHVEQHKQSQCRPICHILMGILIINGDRRGGRGLKEGNINKDQVLAKSRRKIVIPFLSTGVFEKKSLERFQIQLRQVRIEITDKTNAIEDTRFNRKERLRRQSREYPPKDRQGHAINQEVGSGDNICLKIFRNFHVERRFWAVFQESIFSFSNTILG